MNPWTAGRLLPRRRPNVLLARSHEETHVNPWTAGRLLPGRHPKILFGWGYEDPRVELEAFPPGGRVLAIAAAGETVSALAGAGFDVTGVDINPVQLDYGRARLAGAPAVTGSAERLLAAGRAVLRGLDPRWRPHNVAEALRQGDLTPLLASKRLRGLLACGLAPLGLVLRPGFRRSIPPRLDQVLLNRLRRGLRDRPAANPWAWRLLTGRDELATAPEPRHARLIHTDVATHLEQVPRGWYQGVSLSNILDGPDATYAARLERALAHALKPGAVVVLRSFREPAPRQDAGPVDRAMLWGVVEIRRMGAS